MNRIVLFFVLMLTAISACKEIGPIIILEESQVALVDTCFVSSTPIASSPKNILFEEFSGVRCTNCPAGNEATHDLVVQHGNRMIPVTIHNDFLAFPYDGSPDLRNEDANLVANTLGPVNGKPSAFINRKIINGERLQGSVSAWPNLVDNELATTADVNVLLEIVSFDVAERTFRYKVTLEYAVASTSHNLGFYLTESEIIAEQLDNNVHIYDYEHEFVLRKSITPVIGEPIICPLEANTVVVKEFEVDLDDDDFDPAGDWDIIHMELVAFVRQSDDVIANANKVKITN